MANPEEIELAEENVQKDEEDTPKKISSTSEDNNDPELSEEIDLDVLDLLPEGIFFILPKYFFPIWMAIFKFSCKHN